MWQIFCTLALILILRFPLHISFYLFIQLQKASSLYLHFVNQRIFFVRFHNMVMVLTDSSIVKGVNAFKKFYDAETLMEVVSLFIQKTDSHFFILVYQSLLSLEHYRCFSSRRCPRGMIHLVPSPTPQITLTLYNCLSGRGCYLYIQWYFNL